MPHSRRHHTALTRMVPIARQGRSPVVDEHCGCKVEVQMGADVPAPQRLPQAQHILKRKLAFELDEQPPMGGGGEGAGKVV